ncbi:MAG TPA: hypothetical protein VM243_13790, partial [Phycisphaerae bacterium]|nr:hypothetical protein [Phycisphaerae bacterium]
GVEKDSDQALAARYYLAYLAKVKNPERRARILVQLGSLYSTNFLLSKGEKPDYGRAAKYFKQALEAEPNRINAPMLRARLNLVHSGMSAEERLHGRMELYEWLLSLNEEKIRELAMPDNPGETISEADLKWLVKYCGTVTTITAGNLVGGAKNTGQPLKYLNVIRNRFPGTEAAQRGESLLERYTNAIQDLADETQIEQIERTPPAVIEASADVPGKSNRESSPDLDRGNDAPGVLAAPESRGWMVPALACIGFVVVLVLVWLWVGQRHKGKARSQ